MLCATCARPIEGVEYHDGHHNAGCPRLRGDIDETCWCQTMTVHPSPECCDVCKAEQAHWEYEPVEPAVASLQPFAWVGLPACPPEDAA